MTFIPRMLCALAISQVLALTGPAAHAQTVQFRPDYYSVPAAALLPRDNTISYDTNGVRMFPTTGNQVVFQAPVNLPNWSVITRITLEAKDSSANVEFGGFVRATLRQYRYNTFLDLATVQTDAAGAPGDVRVSAPVSNHLTNNQEYSYGIEVVMFNGSGGVGSIGLYKVVIDYVWPEFF